MTLGLRNPAKSFQHLINKPFIFDYIDDILIEGNRR